MLGYPECCVDFYIKNLGKAAKIQMDFVLLAPSSKMIFPYHANVCLRSFGISLDIRSLTG